MPKNDIDKNGHKRVWVAPYNKYLDELTTAEWQEFTDANCDSWLKNCGGDGYLGPQAKDPKHHA